MAAFFLAIAVYPAFFAQSPRLWATTIAAALFSAAMLTPKVLARPNRLWTRLGLLMSGIISPVALAVLFFGVITPYGWLMKRCGKSFIPTQFDPVAESYWIPREPAGPAPESLRNQF